MKKVAGLNDPTSHGGKVITASSSMKINGVPVALINDMVSCPKHGINPIIESSSQYQEDGKGIVVEQCRSACGSVVFASLSDLVISE